MWPLSIYAIKSYVAVLLCAAHRYFRGFRIWEMTFSFSGRVSVSALSAKAHFVSPLFTLHPHNTGSQSRPSVFCELTGGRSHCAPSTACRHWRGGRTFFSLTSRCCFLCCWIPDVGSRQDSRRTWSTWSTGRSSPAALSSETRVPCAVCGDSFLYLRENLRLYRKNNK